jgi:hypothetical protein
MANTDAPRGFQPRRNTDSSYYSGSTNPYPIASGYATAIYSGDLVKLVSGKINKAAAGDQVIGVAAGFKFLASTLGNGAAAYWPASQATIDGNDAQVLVYDDPDVLFEAQFTNSASVPALADVNKYFNLIDAGGNTMWGTSGEGVDYTTITTTVGSGQVQFIEFAPDKSNDTAAAYSRGVFRITKHSRLSASAV